MTTTTKSAKKAEENRVKKTATCNTQKKVSVIKYIEVEDASAQALPVAQVAKENDKVTTKEVLKSVCSVRAAIKEERRGANVTIRLIAERAASGDADAVNILCALCDVPRSALFSLNIDTVRKAVNDFYPFVAVTESGRKINVKAKGVYYTTPATEEETEEEAKKRVIKGYYCEEVTDYLTALTAAAKARAKGIKQRSVNEARVAEDNKFSKFTDVATVDVIAAKTAHTYNFAKVNVWRKHSVLGYYM